MTHGRTPARPATRPAPAGAAASREVLYAELLRIRYLEERLLDLFSKGALFGTTHTSIGQEAIALAVMRSLDLDRDVVFSSHRCHGHFLAYGGDPAALLAEIMGRADGVCGGIGGSQHLHHGNFYSSGVQGGILPLAVGAALAERFRSTGAIATVFLGDGTLGEGVTYEAFNMASLWSAPVLFVLEDNGYAQSTPRHLAVAGSIAGRAEAFGIESDVIVSNDLEVLLPIMRQRAEQVRGEGRPRLQVVQTYRLSPHSKGDDHRDPAEIASWREKDPVRILGARLDAAAREEAEARARDAIDDAVQLAEATDWPDAGAIAPLVPLERSLVPGSCPARLLAEPNPTSGFVSVASDLNAALHAMMAADERVVVLGEDLLDPYGGAFRVTKGLSTAYPERVMTTPISESGIVGVANGMALRGMRPIVEIMFGDFLALAADQIVNHAAKFAGMYNHQTTCPVTIRTPMGGRRGYGPTHSQSIESLFLGLPGLEVVAVSPLHAPGQLLTGAVLRTDRPTLFIENKTMYPKPVQLPDATGDIGPFAAAMGAGLYPTVHLTIAGSQTCDLVLITYGGCVEIAMEAAEELMVEDEIACEILVPSQLSPLPIDDLIEPVMRAGKALIVEEGVRSWGWGAEVASSLFERGGRRLIGGCIERLGARAFPIPVSRPLEEHILPQRADIVAAARALLGKPA